MADQPSAGGTEAGTSGQPIVIDDDDSPRQEDECHFSDGAESPPSSRVPSSVRAGQNADGADYDFSGTVCADASQTTCGLCGLPLETTWDDSRQLLVVQDAVMMRFRIYHRRCAETSSVPAAEVR